MDGAASATLQLEPFNPATDSWSQWEERLHYFIECNGIQGESRKRATLLTGLKEKYRRLFEPGLGELKGVKVRLDIDRTVPPRFCKARSLPYVFKEKVEAQLQKDIDSGVLEEVQNSSWAAPIVPVLKKDGNVRVCGNFKLTANRAQQEQQWQFLSISKWQQWQSLSHRMH
ncbi:uncharacterized protein K02A2.6-like [Amphibalanus amphitrite]|uniref:uncharacterized protein K02A2.6-like n=1 Tax=Amphibalanus amphitrite TaxID=1232801 RepID=UPI001C907CD0|nr:uncharacterized protein K02A2.6-like [Amphibalanus amphitrite]